MKTLNAVQPHDWAKFLRARLDTVGAEAPLDGIARGGYRLVYNDTPTDFFKGAEARRRNTDLTYSLGMVIGREAKITDVLWEGPAFKSGTHRRHADRRGERARLRRRSAEDAGQEQQDRTASRSNSSSRTATATAPSASITMTACAIRISNAAATGEARLDAILAARN